MVEKTKTLTPKEIAEIAGRRPALRKVLRHARAKGIPQVVAAIEKELDEIKKQAERFSASSLGGLGEVKRLLRAQRGIDSTAITKTIPRFAHFLKIKNSLAELSDFESLCFRESMGSPEAVAALKNTCTVIAKRKAALEKSLNALQTKYPDQYRAFCLIGFKRGLLREGHIAATPSVEENLHDIGERIIDGKHMFIHGPTGTGKTSLARLAAETFSGRSAEMIYCNPQTRESHIWGKTGIRPAGKGTIQTVDIPGPLAKAMRDGRIVIFDEFTALPQEQMVFLKGIMNAKPGDVVNLEGNGRVRIKEGFQMIMTANLKSEKNPERQELPPEIAREFGQNNLKVSYSPKEEAYDIMLARLMERDGSINLSDYDLSETLPKFCEALEEIQTAYTGHLSSETARSAGISYEGGKPPSLKKLVLTQGTVEAILSAWPRARRAGVSFVEFLDTRLAEGELGFEEFSESDRVLAAKILAMKGFLNTLSEKAFNLPHGILKGFVAHAPENRIQSSRALKRHSLRDVAALDPWNRKGVEMRSIADALLEGETSVLEMTQEDMQSVIPRIRAFIARSFEKWYGDNTTPKTDEYAVLSPGNIARDPSANYDFYTNDVDLNKSGQFTVNPETVGLDFEKAKDKIRVVDLYQIPEFKKLKKKSLASVANFVATHFEGRYRIPGLEFWQWVIENPTLAPQELKDWKYHYCFGSLLRDGGGYWNVPCFSWRGSEFKRDGVWLRKHGWDDGCRVVLLEN